MLLNRLFIVFLVFVIVLSACERDMGITDQLLFKGDPNAEVVAAEGGRVEDWLRDKIWSKEEDLLNKLLALDKGDSEAAIHLAQQITTRKHKGSTYTFWINAGGIAILRTSGVSPADLVTAKKIVMHMTEKRPKIRELLHYDTGFYMVVYDPEYIKSVRLLPEYYQLTYGVRVPLFEWGGVCRFVSEQKVCIAPMAKYTATRVRYPHRECETNCINLNYVDWDVFVHEFAHAMHYAIERIDPSFNTALNQALQNAVKNDLWSVHRTFSANNAREYLAENVTDWFIPHESYELFNSLHGVTKVPKRSRDNLKEHDPKLYKLLSKWLPHKDLEGIPPRE